MSTPTLKVAGIVCMLVAAIAAAGTVRADVVVNEIHYNPLDGTHEFLELYNTDAAPVDMSNWSIADAIVITFPPGTTIPGHGFLTLVADTANAPCAGSVLQWLSGSLSNGGEIITLLDATSVVVDSLTYDDVAPWPTAPDGSGPSLELINPFLDNGVGASWGASTGTDGTCNAVNSIFSPNPTVGSASPARGSMIASLTQIAVTFSWPVIGVTADDMTVDGVAATEVTGSGAGPYVFTVSTSSTSVVQVVLNPGGIQDAGGNPFAGESWKYFFQYPKIVINENYYHPLNDDEDLQFLELYNDDAATVDLSGWTTAGISHTFAPGTTMTPGSYLVLAKNVAYLQAHVTIPGTAQVVQWSSGDLSNGGETVAITNEYGTVMDTVTYSDSGPWPPVADGDGPSLELINPELPNEYSAAWRASLVTHGTPGAQNGVYDPDPAPIVYGTAQTPTRPAGGQSVTVTASAIARGGATPTMTLYYRQDADPKLPYNSTPMLDDGLHGDGAAGDGTFGATIAGLPAGNQLDFYLTATALGRTAEAPAGHAVLDRFGEPSQTYLTAFSDAVLPTDFPVFQILVTLSHKHQQEALTGELDRREQFDCTFIDGDGNLWYNLTERYRGQSSILKLPSSYRIDFPTDRPLQSPMGFPVTVLQLNSMNPMRQFLGFDLFRRAGIPSPATAWVHLRYTGINYDTCCNGQNGYYGMHLAIEKVDDDFLDSQGGAVVPSRGLNGDSNLYRGQNDGDLRWEGTNPDAYRADENDKNGYTKETNASDDVWDDLIGLCDALNNTPAGQYAANVAAHIDEDNWARFFAIHNLLGNKEGGIYRDTGDDYFLYFNPLPAGDNAKMIPWDTDSVLMWDHETIWRTNVTAVRNVLRHNAFAPIFVQNLVDLLANEYSAATMSAVIDAMPNVFATSGGSDTEPYTRQQFKNWIASQRSAFLAEIKTGLTLTGVPASPYESANPVVLVSGQLSQAGTHSITVNGEPATFSVYAATWSGNVTLTPGMNTILVQAWDRTGAEKERAEGTVFYNPPGAQQVSVTMRAPRRMINTKTLTIEAKIVDPIGRPDFTKWDELGTVSAVRLPSGSPVPITVTVFDNHVTVPADSIRFLNGWGSVSFTLDDGAAFGSGDIQVTVGWNGLTASQTVTVLDAPAYRAVQGTLSGAALTWGPDEVIRVTGNATVPAGSTLTINPGTLVWVDTTGGQENGTLITVNGNVQAVGTASDPIFFFSDLGPAAMTLTQSGSASNANCWRGFFHYGSGTSRYEHVFLTGAGNGPVVSHPRPPILSFNDTHSFTAAHSVFADDNGMVFSGPGTGHYTVQDSLVNRVGIGAEFFGNGHTLLIENTWWLSNGHAPEANNLDGDHMHIDGAASSQLIRGCVLNDGGDDGIDHNGSSFTLQDSIISHIRDKAISMTGGHATLKNVLITSTGSGIRGTASTEYVTIAVGGPIDNNDVIQKTIIWPSTIGTCSGTVSYTDVGDAASLGCGTGNFSSNPMFVNTATHDYDLQAGSPALTAGPGGTRIGWLGFPAGATCQTTAECDDGNPCTFDSCEADHQCSFTPILGCRACTAAAECDDGNPCTVDTCGVSGTCVNAAGNEGASCDDGMSCTASDVCAAGVCAGTESCPGGQHCNVAGICTSEPVTVTFRNGTGGYVGTVDTYVDAALGSQASVTPIVCDGSPEEHILLRFDGMFGPGAGQIPLGSTIASATLTLRVGSGANDQSANPVHLHRLLHAWIDSDVWSAYGVAPWNAQGGIQADGVDAEAAAVATATMSAASTSYPLDVTASVTAWAADPSSAFGWTILPTGTDGLRLESAESATAAYRPLLSVTYTAPVASCTSDPECDDGLYCNGAETCNLGTGLCQSGTPPSCDDGIACTVDSCIEATDTCAHAAQASLCDDGNVCTDDACSAVSGCLYTNNSLSCSDGNACTTGDVCSGGTCTPGGAANCDDGIACTDDTCDTLTGCAHASNCPTGQTCNLTSGVCEQSLAPPLPILRGDSWQYFKGTAEPPADWSTLAFDDTGWLSGSSGFGYGTDCAATRGTELADMQNGYVSVYMRHEFRVDTPGLIQALTLTMDYDDGFVVYLNGQEVARRNVVGTPPAYTQLATADHECSSCNATCNPAEAIDISGYVGLLQAGTNVLAIQAHNLTAGSSDFTLLPAMTAVESGCVDNGDCDDGRACNGVEQCVDNVCVAGTPLACNDGNPCTTDGCNDATGCTATPATAGTSCSDGLFCNGVELCDGAGACLAGTPPACNDGNPCTTDGCNDATGCMATPVVAGTSCADGLYCNGAEACDGAGTCLAGTAPACDDGIACTADICNETTDACDHGLCAMSATAEGPRYIAVTPPADVGSVALRVTSPALVCLPKWIDANGLLTDAPVYRTSAEWATVYGRGRTIVPGTPYTVEVETGSGQIVGSSAATTWAWGDVTHADGINVFDILCVLDGSQGIFTKCPLRAVDLAGDIPDGIVDGADIQAVQNAFAGVPYPDADPCSAQGGR